MKRCIMRAMLVAIILQSISLGAVAPQLSYKDKIRVALQLKIAQVKRKYNDFKLWLCKEDVQAGIKKVALGSAALIGSYALWLYYSNPFTQIIPVGNIPPVDDAPAMQDMPVGNSPCAGLQETIEPGVELIQLQSAEQFGWSGFGGWSCPHYAIYFDALLHNQLMNSRVDFNQRLISNEDLGRYIGHWRQFIIDGRNAHRVANLGGDFLDGEEVVNLITYIQQRYPEIHNGHYNYAVVNSIQELNGVPGVDPMMNIIQDLQRNENYTAGIIVNSAVQYENNDGFVRAGAGHWFVVRVVKRDGILSFYVMDSINRVRLNDPVVRRIIEHLRGQ